MIKWGVRVALVVALCALAVWLWRVLVPTQEQIIHKRLVRIAQLASFSSGESPLVKLATAQELANLCTADAEIAVDIPGQTHRFSGRDEIREAALMARSAVSARMRTWLGSTSTNPHATARKVHRSPFR